jgi:hypothetical protein
MIEESILAALAHLKAEKERLEGVIDTLEGVLGQKPKASAGKAKAKGGRRKRRGKKAPAGLLKQKIIEVLKAARKPVAPAVLRDAVIKAGYPAKNPRTLYSALFAAARGDAHIKKTSAGFSLK